eukprot:gb/GFBE01044051.1/.p1 GENE.gb/GFBE01044051.1/~~gb/GFBE01044051.1/.p1  ORF type:complete len:399 (+),score=58.83 gb/GFBE01044051.1/:1-1197(+)
MDSTEAATKRPLLEDEVPVDLPPAPARGQGSHVAAQDCDLESYSLLQDGADGNDVLPAAGGAEQRSAACQAGSASGGGGVLQFFECEEGANTPALLSKPTPSASSSAKVSTVSERAAPLMANSSMSSVPADVRRHGDDLPREDASRESVVIEMQNMTEEMDQSREPLPVVSASCSAASNALRQGDDRNCFICLQDSDKENPLISCCSTCYARTHVRCWREWRSNQHRTALRSRLLGLRMQTNHMLRCTICKSGTALVDGEENALSWMNELMCGGEPSENSLLARLAAVGNRREDSDEDPEAQLEDLIDTRTCAALVIYLAMLIVVVVVACLLIITQRFWAGDVVLCCIIALYELSVLQLVVLAILRRRGAALAAANPRPPQDAESSAREVQLQTFSPV